MDFLQTAVFMWHWECRICAVLLTQPTLRSAGNGENPQIPPTGNFQDEA